MMLEILVRASVEGALLAATIWMLCRFLRRLSPATRTALWWGVSAKFLVALFWTVPVSVPILPPAAVSIQEAQMAVTAPSTVAGDPEGLRRPGDVPKPARPNPGWGHALVAAWLTGVIVAGGVGVRRWKHMAGVIARSAPSPPGTEAIAAELASLLGLRRVPPVRLSADVGTPLVTGILRPLILLPAGPFAALSQRERRLALCHELTHVKRGDLWLGCLPAIAERVFFFHPLAHFAAREYALCREAACDAHVLKLLDAPPQEYGRLLLRLGVSRPRTSLAVAGAPWSFSTLRRRIAMLDSPTTRSTGSRIAAAAAIGIVALAIAPLRIAARPAAVDAAMEAAAPPQPVGVPAIALDLPGSRIGDVDAPGGRAVQKERDLNYVLFLEDGGTTMSGSAQDIDSARRYRRGAERLVWFRHGSHEYVIRDPTILDQVVNLWKPVSEIGDQQGALGTRQGELGTEQGELGTRQGELGTQQGMLGTRQGQLGTMQGILATREPAIRTDAERDAFEQERRRIDREMRELDREMRALDAKMREFDRPMRELGARMEVLGKEMEVLGRKMEQEVRKAESALRALFERAIGTGAAEIVQ
jgi:bla regulator protein BlaR1